MPRVLRGRDIVCVGSVGWRAHPWTEEHHLTARLARDNRVLFVEPPQADASRLSGPLGSAFGRPREVAGVRVLTVPSLPGGPGHALGVRLTRRAARALGLQRVVLWGFVPEAADLVDALGPDQVVFHCRHPVADAALVRRFAEQADLVLASAPALVEGLGALGIEARYAPAVADTAAFARALADGPVDRAVAALPHPRVLVAGAVTTRTLDVELIAAVARRRRDWHLVLVGPVAARETGALTALRDAPNVHLLGPRPHAAMPEVLRGADAGLVPWKVGEPETATRLPMRLYEYLAAGLPVVATPLPALDGVGDVRLAGCVDTVVAELDAALSADGIEARRARSASAAAHSWDARLEEIAMALRRPAAV